MNKLTPNKQVKIVITDLESGKELGTHVSEVKYHDGVLDKKIVDDNAHPDLFNQVEQCALASLCQKVREAMKDKTRSKKQRNDLEFLSALLGNAHRNIENEMMDQYIGEEYDASLTNPMTVWCAKYSW